MNKLRNDLPLLPVRMHRLPLDHRGFPVPWFVQWFEGTKPTEPGVGAPDFRVVDERKLGIALKQRRCWICGDKLGVHLAFTIGPMCALNRVTSEPPAHLECAEFAVKACPFLSKPRMRRNEKDLPEMGKPAAGFHLDRNPGAACIWVTKSFKPFRPHAGAPGLLFTIGEPERVLWFAEAREATRDEVMASIDSGYPLLEQIARDEGADAVKVLEKQRAVAMKFLPMEM